ncbi:MAG: ATP-dependent zinc metalloprotease FtsH [Tissierellia bacterium]|nr:ATP-dependent zinc metalloprotease FtsH [Tissierellia bacterium]
MKKSIWIYWILVLAILFGLFRFSGRLDGSENITTTQGIAMIESGQVKSVTLDGERIMLEDLDGQRFRFIVSPLMQDTFYTKYLLARVESGEIELQTKSTNEGGFLKTILPYVLMLGLFFFMMNTLTKVGRTQSREAEEFTKNKAKRFQAVGDVITFRDVAGLEEEKTELYEIVDFLKNPAKFTAIGARIPKGVLLVGPPGTGKTYISKAVAGEAGVPFFTISGSEFLEMFVGVGASRVRDLFKRAKKESPCIIFIDEIDAVGRKRGSGLGGGHDEREQTLNQLLVEMDGFEKNEGIIMMAATNRPDILDDALLRPGRFDRTISIGLPDVRGRYEILKIHTKDKPLAEDVDLKQIAKRTPGFTPADLENLVNEAAILSARQNAKVIQRTSIEEASIKVIAGPEKTSTLITPEEKRLVSFHEAGHAIVSRFTKGSDPVHMVTIVPRGRAGGFTYMVPEEELNYHTKEKILGEIVVLLGGRAAEDLMLGDISTGASNDIERATKLAHAMVAKYGMSKTLGTLNYTDDESHLFLGKSLGHSKTFSEETLKQIDEEMREIISHCYQKAIHLLEENKEALIRLAEALMERETIYKREFDALFEEEYNPEDYKDDTLELF